MEEPEDHPLYNKIITIVYVLAIGFYAYMYIDTATDGALSRQAGMYVKKYAADFRTWTHNRKTFKQDVGRVLWEAYTITEEAGNQ